MAYELDHTLGMELKNKGPVALPPTCILGTRNEACAVSMSEADDYRKHLQNTKTETQCYIMET